MTTKNILNVSGGKDSTAMYLLALERKVEFEPVFCDTGNEHEWTLEYVNTLHEKTGGPKVRTLKADFREAIEKRRNVIASDWDEPFRTRALNEMEYTGNPFLDVAQIMAMFPAPWGRYCTRKLKIEPLEEAIYIPYLRDGYDIISWRGIRREESVARQDVAEYEHKTVKLPETARGVRHSFVAYHPILNWSVKQVWKIHKKHKLEPNPLYQYGQNRVGCYPCIYVRDTELTAMARHHPEHIDRLRVWEQKVGRCTQNDPPKSTFLLARGHNTNDITLKKGGIDRRVKLAQESEGNLFPNHEVKRPLGANDMSDCDEWALCE